MIGVLDVLEIELPVVRQNLRAAADDVKRPVQHALQAADDKRAEIGFRDPRHRGSNVPNTRPHNSATRSRCRWCSSLRNSGGHAALPLDAVLERDRRQMAFEIIAPAVIDAGDFLAVPLVRQAQQIAAMGAAVDKGVDRAVRRRARR